MRKAYIPAYYGDVDERKKKIEDLEQQRRENRASLDVLLGRLGETLLGRLGEAGDDAPAETAEYQRLHNDIAGFQAAIQAVEDQLRRFREVEEGIAAVEQDEVSCSKDLSLLYGRLGRLLDEAASDPADAVFAAPWREQTDALRGKISSLEERISALEDKEGGNVFTWIGQNAQGLVMRSFLSGARDNLDHIYRDMGERYSRRDTHADAESSDNGEIAELYAEIGDKRAESRTLTGHLAGLKEERRSISREFSAEGDPLKQIHALRKQSAQARDDLKVLYRRFGAQAAGITLTDSPQLTRCVDSLVRPEDRAAMDEAAGLNQAIIDDAAAIGRLEASLAIDEEQAKIEKCRKMIEEKKLRIAAAEKDIAEFESRIKNAENQIKELQKLL